MLKGCSKYGQQIAVCARETQSDPFPRRKRALDEALRAASPDVRAGPYGESGLEAGSGGGGGAPGAGPSGALEGSADGQERPEVPLPVPAEGGAAKPKTSVSLTVAGRIPPKSAEGYSDRGQEVSTLGWSEVG